MTMTINLNVLVNNEVERQTAIRLAKAIESTLQQALIENGDMAPGVTSTGVVLINEIVKTEKARSINIGATFGSERSRTEISAWATTHMDDRPIFDVEGTYRRTSEPVKFVIHAADEAEAQRYLEGRGESHGLLAYRLTQRDTKVTITQVEPLPDLKALLHKQPSGSILGVLKANSGDEPKARVCSSCGVAEGGLHKLECNLNPARQYPYPRQG